MSLIEGENIVEVKFALEQSMTEISDLVSEKLRDNPEFIKWATEKAPSRFQYATERLMSAAIEFDINHFRYASDRLKSDKNFNKDINEILNKVKTMREKGFGKSHDDLVRYK